MKRSFLHKHTGLITTGLIILVILAGGGCSDAVETTPQDPTLTPSPEAAPSVTPELVPTQDATPTEEIQPTPTQAPLERPQYKLSASLDYYNHRVMVEESIRLSNPAGEVLDQIELVVPPNNWGGVFTITDINTSDIPLVGYRLDVVTLTLDLGSSGWQPGEILEIQISFTLNLPPQNALPGYGPSPFGYTARQTNLVDWYPMVPPYTEDGGWLIHDPWIFGEYLVYPAADFEVSLTPGTPDLVVAASAAPLTAGDTLQYSLPSARNFVFSISQDYQVLEQDLNGVKVFGYIFPTFYEESGQAAFNATVDALTLYQDLYGPYQQSSLSMVQADFDHGMEYEGLYFQSNAFFDTYTGNEKSYLVTIAVHETAHQWWYGQVASDQALEPWLDEALCTFSELAYYEILYPQSVDWWWSTRVNYYGPSGVIDRSIYGFQEYIDQYLNYRNATYLQGAKFMAALKDSMGDEAFYSFLREYGERNKDLIATGDDFFALLGDYIDLSSLVWLGEYFQID